MQQMNHRAGMDFEYDGSWKVVADYLLNNQDHTPKLAFHMTWTSDLKISDMAGGSATLAPWNADIMPEEVIAQCEEMYQAIIDGEVVVLEGPLYDQSGAELLAEGETFTVEELINCYWFLDNVIGDLP